MAVMYAFSVKMHERYLFPALLFALLSFAYLTAEAGGLLRAYAALATASYANVAYVLWQFAGSIYGSYDPNTRLDPDVLPGAAGGHCLRCSGWATGCTSGGRCCPGAAHPAPAPGGPPARRTAAFLPPGLGAAGGRHPGVRLLCLLGPGGQAAPPSPPGPPPQGESVALICRRGGAAPSSTCRASPRTTPTTPPGWGSTSRWRPARMGSTGTDCGTLTDGSVFAWKQYALTTPGRYVRLTALDGSVTLNEAGLQYTGYPGPGRRHRPGCRGRRPLTDEQDQVPTGDHLSELHLLRRDLPRPHRLRAHLGPGALREHPPHPGQAASSPWASASLA